MKSNFARILSLILTSFLIVSMLAACGNQPVNTEPSASESASTAVSESTSTPVSESTSTPVSSPTATSSAESSPVSPAFETTPVTLTAFLDHPQLCKNKWGEDDVSKYITAESGVTLDITYATTGDGTELKLLIASGDALQDFIVTDANGATSELLYKEQIVQPLNKLAEKYFPSFLNYLPKQMNEVYQKADGNLYNTADWFGDPDKLATVKAGKQINQDIVLNKSVYEELGNPKLETLDDFTKYLKDAHAKHPELTYPLFAAGFNVVGEQDCTNLFYRIYGGKDIIYAGSDGKAKYCVSDPAYKNALKYLNTLYFNKLLNPQIFTIKDEERKAVLQQSKVIAYVGQGFSWMSLVENGMTEKSSILPVLLPTVPGIARDSIQLKDFAMGIGGWHGTFVSKDCKDPKRALMYLAFRYTDKMQIAERYGIEGRGWVKGADGNPTKSPEEFAMENDPKQGFAKVQEVYGLNNWNTSWFTTNWVVGLGEYNRMQTMKTFGLEYELNSPLGKDERLWELTRRIKDTDMKVKNDQVMMVWNQAVTRLILSESDAAFNNEYDKLLKDLDGAGIKDVEAFMQKQYEYWKPLLVAK